MKTLSSFLTFGLLCCAAGPLFVTLIPAQELTVRTNYYAMVLHYDPEIWKDGQKDRVSRFYNYRDVDTLCRDYISFLRKASGGQVNWSIVAKHVLDEFPPDNDPDETFTAENYVLLRGQGYDLWDHGHPNYLAICNDPRFGILEKVEAAELDGIWVFGPEGSGFWETAMAGRGAFWVNGGAYPEVNTSRKFIIYGFGNSSHQGVGFMLENTAHMTEILLNTRIMRFWPRVHQVTGWNTLDLNNPTRGPTTNRLHDWELFTTSDSVHWDTELVAPGQAHCGLSHFPPTALYNYGWSPPHYYFDLSWESDAFKVYGGYGLVMDSEYRIPATPGWRALMQGSHHLQDERGSYKVPMIAADADVDAGVRVEPGGSGHAGVLFRCSLYTNGLDAVRGYYLGVVPGSHALELARLDQGYTRVASCTLPIVPSAEYRLVLTLRSNTVRVYLPPHREPMMTYTGLLEGDGAVGMSSYGTAARFTHFKVTPVIMCSAESWRDYPALKRPPKMLTPIDWKGDGLPHTDMDYWYAWWYEHFPKNPGTHDLIDPASGVVIGRALNSWWPYVFDINTFESPFLPTSAVNTPPADTEPPGAPVFSEAHAVTATCIELAWEEALDDVGVTRYEVWRDGTNPRETPSNRFTEDALQPGCEYSYKVRALDGSGNASEFSSEVRVTTPLADPIVQNAHFEHGAVQPTPWQASAFDSNSTNSWERSGGRENSRCIKIGSANTFNDAHWSQRLTGLVPNGLYRLSCWIRGSGIETDTGSHVGANLCSLGTWDHSDALLTGTFDWKRMELETRADADGQLTVGCRLGYWSNLAKGEVWFDDVEVVPVLDGTSAVIPWGAVVAGLHRPPEIAAQAVAVASGGSHALALLTDRSVVSWGDNSFGQTNVPVGIAPVISVSAGDRHSLAVRADGSFVGWGDNSYRQSSPPQASGPWVSVAAGSDFSLALSFAGHVTAWGRNDSGQCSPPAHLGRIVAIGAGHKFGMALTQDGTVSAWGSFPGTNGMDHTAYVPAGLSNVIQLSCGFSHVLALLSDGTVVAWGDNSLGQTQVPLGLRDCIAVAAGGTHSLALRRDGTLVSWGGNHHGQATAPAGLPAMRAISAGNGHSIALAGVPGPGLTPVSFALRASGFNVSFQSEPGRLYSLLYTDSLSPARWQLVRTTVTLDSEAQLTDTSPRQAARFYKVQQAHVSP